MVWPMHSLHRLGGFVPSSRQKTPGPCTARPFRSCTSEMIQVGIQAPDVGARSSMRLHPGFNVRNIRMIERRPENPPPPSGSRGCLLGGKTSVGHALVPVNQDVPLDGCWLFHHCPIWLPSCAPQGPMNGLPPVEVVCVPYPRPMLLAWLENPASSSTACSESACRFAAPSWLACC